MHNTNEIEVTFPDKSQRSYPSGITGLEIAQGISPGLAKKAMFVLVNDQQWDLTRAIEEDAKVEIITRDHKLALEIIRHDTAHILAEAVKELYPETQVTIGPAIENGFYYDFYREKPFTPEDFPIIEKRMAEIVDRDENLTRHVWSHDKAIDYFESIGETFKAELIRDLPGSEEISIYQQGDFIDLCRGPHLPSTKKVGKSFKLMKLAGAYWRGDSTKPQLQRIYGTAWRDDKELKNHLKCLEEAEKRDHRKLGQQMDLFHFQEEAPGSVFWHPRGWSLYLNFQKFIREKISKNGYSEINTPQLLDRKLWEKSGHWEKYHENMFVTQTEDERVFALKPMNCPCHVEMFKKGIKSYRDLPLRLAEFGCCHRYEPSGALHGLMRVRAMVQDDAHIFCTPEQIKSETARFCTLLFDVYKDLGFHDVKIKFADRPEKRAGSDATWDQAEQALKGAIDSLDLDYDLNEADGAFYGPKLEFYIRDAIGRSWQCGTLQLDFVLPERLGAKYIDQNGDQKIPVMLHRAILGSLERFIGVFLEHNAGHIPLWLSPLQVVVAPITKNLNNYAQIVVEKLRKSGIECDHDLSNEKINYKIREHSNKKIPYIFVLGPREEKNKQVSVRKLGQQSSETLDLDLAIDKLVDEIKTKGKI
ncbi:MAG: threonine--tRNA ligase [Rickettsiales bacterium]|nr:threonine--tRNA ligase [Rickettsiales bacterium]|tara:strand:- start:24954 stop:26888 length:1935 start_codon:yes stop_codon:yes gene_type:complete